MGLWNEMKDRFDKGVKNADEKRKKEHEELMRRIQEANNCNKNQNKK